MRSLRLILMLLRASSALSELWVLARTGSPCAGAAMRRVASGLDAELSVLAGGVSAVGVGRFQAGLPCGIGGGAVFFAGLLNAAMRSRSDMRLGSVTLADDMLARAAPADGALPAANSCGGRLLGGAGAVDS